MKKLIFMLLFVLSALVTSQMDTISFIPSKAWFTGWWIASNWQQPFWQKYLLPMTVDGWHMLKFVLLSTVITYVVKKEKLKWYWFFYLCIAWGVIFNIFYILLQKG